MARIDNPHLFLDTANGPPGVLLGAVQRSDEVEGLTWQCVLCERVVTYSWKQIEDTADFYVKAHGEGELDAVPLPPCPDCGGVPCVNNSDIVYGLDEPHHYTLRALDEHVLQRPKLRGRFRKNRFTGPEKFQGVDFSHLPEQARPPQHAKLGPDRTGRP